MFHLADAAPKDQPVGDDVLDRGFGAAVLCSEACARIVVDALLHDDDHKYALHAWCVMPNHVHVMAVIASGYELGAVVREWKTITARRINVLLDQRGPVWARDYFDRFVRNHDQYLAAKEYIERNPVAAGLCNTPSEWRFSSAGWID